MEVVIKSIMLFSAHPTWNSAGFPFFPYFFWSNPTFIFFIFYFFVNTYIAVANKATPIHQVTAAFGKSLRTPTCS